MKEVLASQLKVERLQTRVSTNSDYIDDIADRMTAGDTFPPITVYREGKEAWLADGIHRLDGAIKAKQKISVDERNGCRADAVAHACGANSSHGLRRTAADKRRAIKLALSTFSDQSSRAIAELCGVGHQLVEDVRREIQVDESSTLHKKPEKTRVGKDGKRQPVEKSAPAPPPVAATDFDPSSFKTPKPGTQKRKPADRKAALQLLGKLVRALDKLGLSGDLEQELRAINQSLKDS